MVRVLLSFLLAVWVIVPQAKAVEESRARFGPQTEAYQSVDGVTAATAPGPSNPDVTHESGCDCTDQTAMNPVVMGVIVFISGSKRRAKQG